MPRPPLADVADLERLLGDQVANPDQALALLERASEVVRAYAGETWLDDDGELDGVPDQLPGLVAGVVERAIHNPGVTQEAAGPFSVSFGADASQRVYLTRPEKAVIRAAVGRSALGAIPTTRGPLDTPGVLGAYGYTGLPEGFL